MTIQMTPGPAPAPAAAAAPGGTAPSATGDSSSFGAMLRSMLGGTPAASTGPVTPATREQPDPGDEGSARDMPAHRNRSGASGVAVGLASAALVSAIPVLRGLTTPGVVSDKPEAGEAAPDGSADAVLPAPPGMPDAVLPAQPGVPGTVLGPVAVETSGAPSAGTGEPVAAAPSRTGGLDGPVSTSSSTPPTPPAATGTGGPLATPAASPVDATGAPTDPAPPVPTASGNPAESAPAADAGVVAPQTADSRPHAATGPNTAAAPVALTSTSSSASAQPATVAASPAALPTHQGDLARMQVSHAVAQLSRRGNGDHTMTIRLDPEDLGQVDVTIRTSRAGVDVTLAVARPDVAASLAASTADLQRLLQQNGIESTGVDVHDRGGDGRPAHDGEQARGEQPAGAWSVAVPAAASSTTESDTDPGATVTDGVDLHL